MTRDPVRIVNAITTFVLAVVAVLVGPDVIDGTTAAIVIGIVGALNLLVQELFVRPATVPRVPLEEMAAAEGKHVAPQTPPAPEPA